MRIIDVLNDPIEDSDDEIDEGKRRKWRDLRTLSSSSSSSGSSRSLFSCLFSKCSSNKVVKEEEEEEESDPSVSGSGPKSDGRSGALSSESGPGGDGSNGGGGGGSGERSRSEPSGGKPGDISFKLGMGLGLVFLLAKAATEFNRMLDLTTQMEVLVKQIKQVQSKDAIASSSDSNDNISISPSRSVGIVNTNTTVSVPNVQNEDALVASSSGSDDIISISPSCSCGNLNTSRALSSISNYCISDDMEGKISATESYRQLNYDTAIGNARCLSMDQMEAELIVELERLQLYLEGEDTSVLQRKFELASNDSDPSVGSFSINLEEDNYPIADNDEHYGVSPHELERRLHELLETRQQERIAELEAALECAERKLHEKEMELSWRRA